MTGGVWVASYVALWLAVLALGFCVVALLRQVGVLHTRLAPLGVHPAREGPTVGTVAPALGAFDWSAAALTLLAFTSPTCTICAEILPGLRAIGAQYREVQVEVVSHEHDTHAAFDAFGVRSTPYVVAVDRNGVVRGRGVANSVEQVEELIERSLVVP